EDIRLREFARRRLWQLVALREHGEHLERRPYRQRSIAAAANQLQRLRDELDLADAARPELHMPGELAPLDVAPNLGMQAAHGVERGVIQILAVDERPHDLRELGVLAAAHFPRNSARLDP